MKSSAIMDAIRGIFATFDRGIYNLISTTYELITTIANVQIVKDTFISDMANKFYSFIAVFMVFKICFSLINYLINPDSILDKQKGGAKLITNIVVTFALIIITPVGFDLLREAQSAILDEGIINKIVSGEGYKDFQISPVCGDLKVMPGSNVHVDFYDSEYYRTGQYFALVTIRPFIQVNSHQDAPIDELVSDTNYCKSGLISDILSYDVITFDNSNSKAQYAIDYSYFVSTLVGGAILLILLSFTFDVALRSIKLIFLEIIAPIPVMSFIDPNSGKKGLFGKWLKEVGVTWADLFLRLFAVTFSTTIISGFEFNDENGFWVNLIMLAGVLLFAKKLPDILKKMFNIDLKGDFSLNPLKKLKEAADVAKPVTGLATGLAGIAVGATNFGRGNTWKQKLANGFSGMKKGAVNGYKNPYSITKGALSSLSPYADKFKKSWNETDEAIGKLQTFDEFEKKGKKYVDKALKLSNGKLTDDGKKYDIDDAKVKMFTNDEYKKSYMEVQSTKKKLKAAKEKSKAANSELQRIVAGNLTDSERQRIASGITTYEELKNNADRFASEQDSGVEKLENVLSSKKERHKIVQQKYASDAKIESAMEEYLNRNPDALNVANANISHAEFNNQNNYVNPQNNDKSQEQQFKNYDEIIRDRTEKRDKINERLANLDKVYGEEEEKERLRKERDEYQKEIEEAENKRKNSKDEELSYMEQSRQNAIDDFNNGVDQIHTEEEINHPTSIIGPNGKMDYQEYQDSMKGETSIAERVKNIVSGGVERAHDAITRSDNQIDHITSHINEETNSHFDSNGRFDMSGSDMIEEALRRDEEARNQRKIEEEKKNKRNRFFN